MADQGIGGSSKALREMDIIAVNVRGEVVHPECRTEDELRLTVRFMGPNAVAGVDTCDRCGGRLHEIPEEGQT